MRSIRTADTITGAALLALLAFTPCSAQVVVTGTVRDSLTGKPFAGAQVELVPVTSPWLAGFSARSDSSGRYTISDVVPGTYHFGFQHPRLDSLGMDPVVRTLEVRASRARITADLALPTARTFARTLCRARSDNSGVLIGRVIDARDGQPIARGTVHVRWGTVRVADDGVRNEVVQRTAQVRDDGRFIACNVPTDGPIEVQAVADSPTHGQIAPLRITSGNVELTFDYDTPLRHRDLYVALEERDTAATGGSASADVARVGAASTADSVSRLARGPRMGSARMTGRVIAENGRPVRAARIIVREAGAEGISDTTGAFRLTGLPLGTHTVEMLALGFDPMRTATDLRADRDAIVTFNATGRVRALTGITVRDRAGDPGGFKQRRARGLGYFVDADQIRRWGPPSLGNALAMSPMLRRGMTGRGGCTPTIFVDGVRIEIGPVDEVLVGMDIGGVEVYANPADVPPQFGSPGSRLGALPLSGGCSTIVVWTKAFVN